MKYDENYNVNDTYRIKYDWAEYKKLCQKFEARMTTLLSAKKVKEAGTDCRRMIRQMAEMQKMIAKKILKQRQDYDSDYS